MSTINYPHDEPLHEAAERISAEARTEAGPRPSSGLQRDHIEATPSAADYLPKDYDRPVYEASSGSGSAGRYVHSARISSAHDSIRDAHRRPAWHELGTPQPVSEAWAVVLEAIADAKEAMRAIPQIMRKAEQDRAAALSKAKKPTALPSPGDARAWGEQQALEAIRAAREARETYDRLAVEHRQEHAANLAETVPSEAEAIRERVSGLRADLDRLREGVAAITEAAGGDSRSVMPNYLPAKADLSGLDGVEAETVGLVEVAHNPTQPRCRPTLRDRAAIARADAQYPGISPAFLDLARQERAEEFAITSYTQGTPDDVLANAAQNAAYGL